MMVDGWDPMMVDGWDPIRARLSVQQAGAGFMLQVDVRGLPVGELRASVRDDTVTISGSSNPDGDLRPFCRTVRLPTLIAAGKTEASCEDGVLTLMLSRADPALTTRSEPPAAVPPRPVLVVEDDEAIRTCVSAILSEEGYQVVTAADGETALRLVGGAPPQVILLDMQLPVMDGWEFARAYRRTPGPHAPILTVTAAPDAAKRAAQIGADGYVPKPFDLDALLATVRQHATPA
jgi:CheY-like chemotaxis protein